MGEQMDTFRIRAVEVHSSRAWDYAHIMCVLEFAAAHNLNALVLHRNDVVEQVVYPGRQFGVEAGAAANIYQRYNYAYRTIYRYTPTRRSGPLLRRGYLNRVVEEARRRGIAVYLQNKELSFPDVLLELHPQLIKDGHACPTDPFWFEFLRTKYEELFQDVPGIAGIITSVGTGESRVSITSNRCTCATCAATTPEQWYRQVIEVLHRTISAQGKQLVLRDFVFTRSAHDQLAAAFNALPPEIALAIKDTPHDYYPTFPQNRLIAQVRGRAKWIEYDTMAQYFGWGIGPATMIEYMQQRMRSAHEHGAEAIILRTDWESLDGHTAFDTPNVLNLLAGAALGRDLRTTARAIYRDWLEDADAFRADALEPEREQATAWIASVFSRNWEVVRRALYTHDCVFNDCSTFPVGIGHALWLAEEKNSLKDWVPEKADALAPTRANSESMLIEKNEALRLVRELRAAIDGGHPALTPAFAEELRRRYEAFEMYVEGFRALARLFIAVRYREAAGGAGSDATTGETAREASAGHAVDAPTTAAAGAAPIAGRTVDELFAETVADTRAVVRRYYASYAATAAPSAVYQLINPERLECFLEDAERAYKLPAM